MEENTETYPPLTQEQLNREQLMMAYYTDPDTVVLVVKHPGLNDGGANAGFALLSGENRHGLAKFLTLSEEEVTQLTLRNIAAEPEAVAEQARWAEASKLPQPYIPQQSSVALVQGPPPSPEELDGVTIAPLEVQEPPC